METLSASLPVAPLTRITYVANSRFLVSGETFKFREDFKTNGGAWLQDSKSWSFPGTSLQKVRDLITAGVPESPPFHLDRRGAAAAAAPSNPTGSAAATLAPRRSPAIGSAIAASSPELSFGPAAAPASLGQDVPLSSTAAAFSATGLAAADSASEPRLPFGQAPVASAPRPGHSLGPSATEPRRGPFGSAAAAEPPRGPSDPVGSTAPASLAAANVRAPGVPFLPRFRSLRRSFESLRLQIVTRAATRD